MLTYRNEAFQFHKGTIKTTREKQQEFRSKISIP